MTRISETSNIALTKHSHLSTIKTFPRTKCEFCDVTLTSDLDVTRHLASALHRTKKAEHLSLISNQDRLVEKEIPKNLKQVFELLKLRSGKDLIDLNDKDYFESPDENTAEIADDLSSVLLNSIVKFETKHLKPEERKMYLSLMRLRQDSQKDASETRKLNHGKENAIKKESEADKNAKKPSESIAKKVDTSSSTSSSKPTGPKKSVEPRARPTANKPTKSKNPTQSKESTNSRRPKTSKLAEPTESSSLSKSTKSKGPIKPTASTSSIKSTKSKNPVVPNPSTSASGAQNSEDAPKEPALGQNWDYIPKLAIIKIEPKD